MNVSEDEWEKEEREIREWARRNGYSERLTDALVRYVAENIAERGRRAGGGEAQEARGG